MAADRRKIPVYQHSFSTPTFTDDDDDDGEDMIQKDDPLSDSSSLNLRRRRDAFGNQRSLTFRSMQAQVSLAHSLRNLFQSAAKSGSEDVDGHMENAWLQAVYNAVVFALVGVVSAVALGVYFILEPFLHPILWAVLLGTFLFPFKKSCTTRFTLWLYRLECSAVPLCIGMAVSPFAFLGYLSSCLGDLIVTYWKHFVFAISGMAAFYVFAQFNVFPTLFLVAVTVGEVFEALDMVLSLIGPVLVVTVLGAFILSVIMFKLSVPHSRLFAPLSVVVWFLMMCSLAKWLFGAVGLTLTIGLFSTACLTYFIRSKVGKKGNIKPSNTDPTERKQSVIMEVITDSLDRLGMSESGLSPGTPPPTRSVRFSDEHVDFPVKSLSVERGMENGSDEDDGEGLSVQQRKGMYKKYRAGTTMLKFEKNKHRGSNQVFLLLVTCCLMVVLWSKPWLLLLVCLLLVWGLAWRALDRLSLQEKWRAFHKAFSVQFCCYMQVLWPEPLPTFVELCLALDHSVLHLFRLSVGGIMSAGIIVSLLVGSLALIAFLVFEIQIEMSYTINMATQVLNTSIDNSWIVRLSGDAINSSSDIHDTMEQIANYSFHCGRDWLTAEVQKILGDDSKDSMVVEQVIQIYDDFYHTYVLKNSTSILNPEQKETEKTVKVWNIAASFSDILNFSAVLSLLKSLWSVVSVNLSMALSVLTFFSVLVFSGGTLLLNFTVFITVLFYLLCYSQEEYLPVQWVVSALPDFVTNSSENDYPETFSRVIRSVFHASLRRMGFYSLYTWMVLSVLGIPMIILPSVLAGIAGAVPFVGPYWVGLPAILQLWLVEERVGVALLALVLFLMPPFLIDSIINSEIEGSHPYLTGLAIVGGVYYAGLGGALIGPILLCCLLFVVQVMTDYL